MIVLDDHVGVCNNNVPILTTKPTLLTPSKINLINWQPVLLKMLQSVFFFDNIERDSVLLVNIVNNKTNGILQASKITDILIRYIADNTQKYNVVDMKVLYSVYREWGVFPEDNRNSYNFSIKIANYLKANYILYSIASGDSVQPNLELQLISVKTGEILRIVNSSVGYK
ncbi:penicillin-binding protein activator LpoB [Blochmannia endosymbiont of Camponotus sp. C-003]|uniref:penicillin-binding protein activator LpoB n=1 Tax=unclassified Candidatus Blochmanniella TaxID=711328 RepID=UPI0020258169|nr:MULTISPECIES: penicillin-binding protein activator LpoB [unclassified Candidatus Blochmannia]URJ23422.1 penicillin-binding protein activator LpoB [Blochmannia endosymbiont of Camponotus sp. C-003]URJ28894.1 penicillin-binding protein activator LpoB [Blochmannia endosymbiont of Camponotus sp. C-046]